MQRLLGLENILEREVEDYHRKSTVPDNLMSKSTINQQNLNNQKEFYNIITEETAHPDELISKSHLQVPIQPIDDKHERNSIPKQETNEIPQYSYNIYDPLLSKNDSNGFGEKLTVASILEQQLRPQMKNVKNSNNNNNHKGANIIAFADVIRKELDDKQKMIENLLDDIKERTNAIQVCGKDIRALREENMALQKSIEQLQQNIQQTQSHDQIALQLAAEFLQSRSDSFEKKLLPSNDALDMKSSQSLQTFLSQQSPILRTLLLQLKTSFQQELQNALTNQDFTHVQTLHRKQQEYQQVLSQYQELQSAHLKQSQILVQYKKEYKQIENYQRTIQTQEKIITRLQNMVEVKMKSKFVFTAPSSSESAPGTSRDEEKSSSSSSNSNNNNNNNIKKELEEKTLENGKLLQQLKGLEEKVQSLEKEREEEHKKLQEKQDNSRPSTTYSETNPSQISNLTKANLKIDQLIAENISKQFRIEALEQQSENASREAAREIARLRTKLFELELGVALAGSEEAGSDQQYDERNDQYHDDDFELDDQHHEDIDDEEEDQKRPISSRALEQQQEPVLDKTHEKEEKEEKDDEESLQVLRKALPSTKQVLVHSASRDSNDDSSTLTKDQNRSENTDTAISQRNRPIIAVPDAPINISSQVENDIPEITNNVTSSDDVSAKNPVGTTNAEDGTNIANKEWNMSKELEKVTEEESTTQLVAMPDDETLNNQMKEQLTSLEEEKEQVISRKEVEREPKAEEREPSPPKQPQQQEIVEEKLDTKKETIKEEKESTKTPNPSPPKKELQRESDKNQTKDMTVDDDEEEVEEDLKKLRRRSLGHHSGHNRAEYVLPTAPIVSELKPSSQTYHRTITIFAADDQSSDNSNNNAKVEETNTRRSSHSSIKPLNKQIYAEMDIEIHHTHRNSDHIHVYEIRSVQVKQYPYQSFNDRFTIHSILEVPGIWSMTTPSIHDPSHIAEWKFDYEDHKAKFFVPEAMNTPKLQLICQIKQKATTKSNEEFLVGQGSMTLVI